MFRLEVRFLFGSLSAVLLVFGFQALGAKKEKDPCVDMSVGGFPSLREVTISDPFSHHNQQLALGAVKDLSKGDPEKVAQTLDNLIGYIAFLKITGGVPNQLKRAIRYEASVRKGVTLSPSIAAARLLLAATARENSANQKMAIDLLFNPSRDIAWNAFKLLAEVKKKTPKIINYLRTKSAYLNELSDEKNSVMDSPGIAYGRLLLGFLEPDTKAAQLNISSVLTVDDKRINYVASQALIAIGVAVPGNEALKREQLIRDGVDPSWFKSKWIRFFD